jgi:hypothetical protein
MDDMTKSGLELGPLDRVQPAASVHTDCSRTQNGMRLLWMMEAKLITEVLLNFMGPSK